MLAALALPVFWNSSPPFLELPKAAAEAEDAVQVKARLLSNFKAVAAGAKLRLGVELEMQPGWHTYYREAGEAGMPTKIEWLLPQGFKAEEPLWEMPHKMVDSGITTYGYEGSTLIASAIEAPADLKTGEKLEFKAKVKWLACKDACVPGKDEVSISLPVVASATEMSPENTEKFEKVNFNGPASKIKGGKASANPKNQGPETENQSLGVANKKDAARAHEGPQELIAVLAFAFIGGFILNFMPCVLPVISIKIFSLVQQAGEDPKKVFAHGMTFAAGIIFSFLALGSVVIAIQSAGQNIGWGFQFQYPVFVLAMASVVTVFALSFFGVFYVDVGSQNLDKLASTEGLGGTFFKGVLATVLSTPCTAPFLGTALGFAFVQPWWLILTIFSVIALGMSSPYLVLAVKPDWMKFLPKPGDWMERFKESLGFLLLATSIWLLSVLTGLVEPDAIIAALGFLLFLSVSAWLIGKFINLSSSPQRRFIVWAVALAVAGGGYLFFLRPYPELLGTRASLGQKPQNKPDGIQWQEFSQAKLDQELEAGHEVFIDFTAKWCLTCKANEATIIETPEVQEKIKSLQVVALKADWTAQDAEITQILRSFGRSGVPLYVVYPKGDRSNPIILPEALSRKDVLEALDKGAVGNTSS